MTETNKTTLTVPQPRTEKKAAQLVFVSALVITLATIFSPPFLRIQDSPAWEVLGLTETQYSLFSAVRGLFFIIFILFSGVSGDFWGRKRVLQIALTGFIVCILLMIFSSLSGLYLIIYSISTILGIMVRILTVTMVMLAFKGKERVIPVMIYSVFIGIGVLLSPLLAKLIGQHAGLRSIFLLPMVLSFIGYFMMIKYIPESRASGELDRKSGIALVVWVFGLGLMIFSIILSGGLGWTHPLVLTGLLIGGSLMLVLRALEFIKLPQALKFHLNLKRQLSIAIFAGVIINIALYAVAVQTFNFLSEIKHYTSFISGLALSPIVIGIILCILSARYTIRWDLAKALTISLVVLAIPAALLSFIKPNTPYWLLVPSLVLVGFGFILGNSPRLLLLFSSVPVNLSATVQAIGSSVAQLGNGLAYSFMLTLVQGFGVQALQSHLQNLGLTRIQASISLLLFAEANDELVTILPSKISQQVNSWIQQAYVIGLSRAMLALSGICLISAAIVYLGLRNSVIEENSNL